MKKSLRLKAESTFVSRAKELSGEEYEISLFDDKSPKKVVSDTPRRINDTKYNNKTEFWDEPD